MSLNKFLHSFAKFPRKNSNMTLGHPGGKTRNLTETRNNWFDNNTKLKFSQLFLNNWSRPKKKRVLYFNDSFTCQVKNFCSCNKSLHDNIWLKRQNMKYAHFRPDMITCNFLSSAKKSLFWREDTQQSHTMHSAKCSSTQCCSWDKYRELAVAVAVEISNKDRLFHHTVANEQYQHPLCL